MINRKTEKRMNEMAEKTFSGHAIQKEVPTKTWRVAGTDKCSYWYNVTWTPGFLTVSGDIGEMTVVHYHALNSIDNSIGWVNGACFEYLMEKTDIEKKFDPEETVESLVYFADEDQRYWDKEREKDLRECIEASKSSGSWYSRSYDYERELEKMEKSRLWKQIFDRFSYSYLFDFPEPNYKRKDHQSVLIKDMKGHTEITAQDIYELCIDDYYGTYNYDESCYWKYKALKTWAKLMLVGNEEKAA